MTSGDSPPTDLLADAAALLRSQSTTPRSLPTRLEGIDHERRLHLFDALLHAANALTTQATEEVADRASKLAAAMDQVELDLYLESADLDAWMRRSATAALLLDPGAPLRLPDSAALPVRSSTQAPPVVFHADWTAMNGLGVAARRLAADLEAGGVALERCHHATGAPPAPGLARQEPSRCASATSTMAIHLWGVNLNIFDQVPDADLRPHGARRHHIATWYWELPSVPERFRHQLRRVDELWAPTSFIARALQRHHHVETFVFPPSAPVLEAPADPAALRRRCGLDPDAVVVLLSFDGNSSLVRKNPWASLQAFTLAQASTEVPLQLVIKLTGRAALDAASAGRLERGIAEVGAVVIDEDLDDAAMASLFGVADLYLSLHRSEGLGLGMVEAMAASTVVVATAFGGNLEVMDDDTAALVGYDLLQVSDADFAEGDGLKPIYTVGAPWAEADIDQAARWIVRLAEDRDLREAIARSALQRSRTHSAARSGAAMVERLVDLGTQLEVHP